jgi:hypothetical protein
VDAVFAEVARVLRPGGRWVFSVTHPVRWMLPGRPDPGRTACRALVLRPGPVRGDRRPRRRELRRVPPHHRGLGTSRGRRRLCAAGTSSSRRGRSDTTGCGAGGDPERGRTVPGTAVLVTELR